MIGAKIHNSSDLTKSSYFRRPFFFFVPFLADFRSLPFLFFVVEVLVVETFTFVSIGSFFSSFFFSSFGATTAFALLSKGFFSSFGVDGVSSTL